ncbi:MAG: hypothetical protein ACPGVG_10405 [Mycobacterium sp.]
MQRPATWKVLTLGAAMSAFGVLGAGTAIADNDEAQLKDSRTIVVAPSGDGDILQEDSRVIGNFCRRSGIC